MASHLSRVSGMLVCMISKTNSDRRYNWAPLPRRAERETRWSSLYAALSPSGAISLSRLTHESMGSPDAYVIMYDADVNVMGLQPARLAVTKNAYPAHARGKRGGQRIFAHTLISEFNLYVPETVRFPRVFIDRRGVLILELNVVKAAARKRERY